MAKAKTKSKAKPAPRKRATSAKRTTKKATARDRRPGRRPHPNEKVLARHAKVLTKDVDLLNEAEQLVQDRKNVLAGHIDEATADDCSTTWICETVGKSRQTVFKLVAERVDGKKLNPNWGPGSEKGKGRPAGKTKAKADKKPAKAKVSKPAKAKPTKAKAKTKATKKAAKPAGKKANLKKQGEGKLAKVPKPPARKPARRPRPALRPRPKATA